MRSINDEDLKAYGFSAITKGMAGASHVTVSVHGEDRFVFVTIEHRRYLRECELLFARAESQRDMTAGHFIKESVDAHLRRLDKL